MYTYSMQYTDPVIINMSGQIYHLKRATFRKLPPSVMENAIRIESTVDKRVQEEYYLERHAESFNAILWYYTNGELHMPNSVCPAVFSRELKFWKVDPKRMSRCCYIRFVSFYEDQALLKSFEEVETKNAFIDKGRHLVNTRWERFRKKAWDILDDPTSCTAAKVYVGISAFFILVSIFVLCASTHPSFQRELEIYEWKEYYKQEPAKYNKLLAIGKLEKKNKRQRKYHHNPDTTSKFKQRWRDKNKEKYKRNRKNRAESDRSLILNSSEIILEENNSILVSSPRQFASEILGGGNESENDTASDLPANTHSRYKFLDILDYCMVTYFTAEFVVRLLFCPVKSRFFKSVLNIIDMVALSSECMIMIFEYIFPKERFTNFSLLDIIECIQIARVFRLFRLIKNFVGFRVLIYSVKASVTNMMLMVFLLLVAALIFSTIVFYCDRKQFPSIPDAIWWAIITMTTVGYGDMHPDNIVGKIIGCLCAISGVFVLSVLIPVLVNNFLLFLGFARIPSQEKDGLASMVQREFEIREYQAKGKLKVQLSCP